jgi:hypothetical protein
MSSRRAYDLAGALAIAGGSDRLPRLQCFVAKRHWHPARCRGTQARPLPVSDPARCQERPALPLHAAPDPGREVL